MSQDMGDEHAMATITLLVQLIAHNRGQDVIFFTQALGHE